MFVKTRLICFVVDPVNIFVRVCICIYIFTFDGVLCGVIYCLLQILLCIYVPRRWCALGTCEEMLLLDSLSLVFLCVGTTVISIFYSVHNYCCYFILCTTIIAVPAYGRWVRAAFWFICVHAIVAKRNAGRFCFLCCVPRVNNLLLGPYVCIACCSLFVLSNCMTCTV